MNFSHSLILEIKELLDCDLNDSALQLAELECRPRLKDTQLPADDRLALLRAYTQCLGQLKHHRASLRTITEFVSGPIRSQLNSSQLEGIARDIAGIRWQLGEFDMCLAQLRQIPKTHRTVQDLARMARSAALIQSPDAEDLYSELLRAQPNATEAFTFLQTRNRQNTWAADGSTYHDSASLATARSLMQKLEYRRAVSELQRLGRRHRGNALIVALQATCYYMLEEPRRARALYERARVLDSGLISEMATYADLLASDSLAVYTLGSQLLKTDQARAEGWVAMARYFLATGQTQEALAIVWKAQVLAPGCAEAHSAEGTIQLAAGSPEEAAEAFLKAHELSRSMLTFRGLVDSYVRCAKYKEAFMYAKEAAELMPRHAGTLAMVGMVLSHSVESSDKAARLLQAALEIDCHCTEAVTALASLHVANQQFDAAVALIEKYLPDNESDDMYTHYADVLTLANELPKAAVNYNTALSINPDNERARVGYERIDKLMHPGSAEFEGEDMPDEVDEADEDDQGEPEPELELRQRAYDSDDNYRARPLGFEYARPDTSQDMMQE
ncbi:Anaphase promoting complex subunit 7 [Kickxella alabastrina]|nr:Anaphase promoting complex subunit 7 [Kickxella alabastrina]